jgi:hypothetical protein
MCHLFLSTKAGFNGSSSARLGALASALRVLLPASVDVEERVDGRAIARQV